MRSLLWATMAALMLASAGRGAKVATQWEAEVAKSAREVGFHGVILIESEGKVVLNEALGDTAAAAGRDTRYWIASISKSFTATLIFRLRERGALKREDTLAKFFPDAPADKRAITVEQLLTHTSGLPNKYASEGIMDRAEAVRNILALPLLPDAGKAFHYTNDGYSLLAAIAEVAGKSPFPELLRQEILEPASMSNSGLWPKCEGASPVLPLPETLPEAMQRENWGYKGPDGICSSTADLARWMDALRNGKILQPDSLRAMWEGKVAVSAGSATPGWFRSTSGAGTEIIWTRGTDHGHNSIIKYYAARGLMVVSLSSSKDPEGPLLARMLVDNLEKRLGW